MTLRIRGMHCDGCASRVKTLLAREPGVREADASCSEGHARVRFNEHATSLERLIGAIEHAGFEVTERS